MAKFWYLFLIPLFVVLSLVEFYPIAYSIYLSLVQTNGKLGLSVYSQMAGTGAFWNAMNISLLYSMTSTIMAVLLGLGLTFILIQNLRGRGIFEAFFVFPLAAAPIVVGVLWSPAEMWDDIQTFIHFVLHFPFFNELSPAFFFPVMAYAEAWEWSPLIMLVCLSIYNSTPKQIYEAADLYGASAWQKFRTITIPMILRSPVIQFVVVLRFIDAMRAFEIPLTWSSWVGYSSSVGSPVDTLSLYLYKLLFIPTYGFPINLVSAMSLTLFVITLFGAAVMFRLTKAIGGE